MRIKFHHPIEKQDNLHKEMCMKINLIQNSAEHLLGKCMLMKLLMLLKKVGNLLLNQVR